MKLKLPPKTRYVFGGECLLAGLCKTNGHIPTKLGGRMRNGARKNPLDFDEEPGILI